MERNYLNEWKTFLTEQSKQEILQLQQALNRVWTNVKIKEDGIMGPETTKYIKLFQQQNALPVTGKVDDALKGKLLPLLRDAPAVKGNEQTKMPAVLNAQEKAKIIAIALELYNAGKVQNLDPNLKTDLEAIKTKYPIDKRPDFAANVFDVYVEKNPLFLYIDKNNI